MRGAFDRGAGRSVAETRQERRADPIRPGLPQIPTAAPVPVPPGERT